MCDWQGYERRGIMEDWDDTASINSCKTAEEMFAELGFHKSDKYTTENIVYENSIYEEAIEIKEEIVEFSGTDCSYRFEVSKNEILAIAQLIKEMEADNG